MYLYDKLSQYGKKSYYPFHMPGHKRNLKLMGEMNPYAIDITEIDGFDNLHDPEDVILESMKRAEKLYQSEKTFYLVNGSTAGILTGISACTKKGDKILMARNCHKAAYHAVFVNELNPVYLYPQFDNKKGIQCGYSAEYIKNMLIKHPDTSLIVLVSPTYEGVVSEIKEICKLAHERNIPVLVDEAHGAHFAFHRAFPSSALELGADVVIQSVHKTLPAFTQTALLHINSKLVDIKKIKTYFSIYQTSSPSYVLMAGIDQCIGMLEERREELFENLIHNLRYFYEEMSELNHIKVIEANGRDLSKILISTKGTNMTGPELYDILLKKYKLQMEMAEADYVLAITTIGDTKEGFDRLMAALREIDTTLSKCSEAGNASYTPVKAEVVLLQHKAFEREKEYCLLEKSENRIAGGFVNLYPPGIPILVPGEKITHDILEHIYAYQETGLSMKGLKDEKYVLCCL
ncbi:aminotransferase class I/II-fold pyridoxal phosphate-dependent enzyme [[Clostridium] polysaccharolyticum]|uniref:Arginine/lysine/ornithine decarboxylase n=1 Tax=[Clostridium] polysaccharolyticum TaxID=29364 RepID=A0A1I0FP83_9FIRM|nr:aminotransferase class I/II-fold pyridoxal phosphate-dependent enzyme [[Clostridium] polysaccharolyticum]SET59953.1 Arginine/lysine/ornithine decarboxylase [[Clostridium] polysaccharolyticum]